MRALVLASIFTLLVVSFLNLHFLQFLWRAAKICVLFLDLLCILSFDFQVQGKRIPSIINSYDLVESLISPW